MRKYLSISSIIMPIWLIGSSCPTPTPTPTPGPGAGWNEVRIDNHPSILPVAVAIADMDGDTLPDVVSAWRGAPIGGGTEIGMIVIHFQLADGTWETVIVDQNTRYVQVNGITVGDINNDQNPDIVVAAQNRIVYMKAPIAPRLVNNWAFFEIESSIAAEFVAWFDVDVGQIDGQNGLDIAAALADDGRVVWFQSPQNPDAATGWTLVNIDSTNRAGADSVMLIDLDKDQHLDIVSSASGETANTIAWYEQPTNPVVDPWTRHDMSNFAGATRFDMADLDGDTDIDIAVISPTGKRGAWLLQPTLVASRWGGFVLADFSSSLDGRVPTDIVIADINGDTQKDVVISTTSPGGIFWFTPKTNNQLKWQETTIVLSTDIWIPGLIDAADIDKDSDIDVVAPLHDSNDARNDRVNYYENLRIEDVTTAP